MRWTASLAVIALGLAATALPGCCGWDRPGSGGTSGGGGAGSGGVGPGAAPVVVEIFKNDNPSMIVGFVSVVSATESWWLVQNGEAVPVMPTGVAGAPIGNNTLTWRALDEPSMNGTDLCHAHGGALGPMPRLYHMVRGDAIVCIP